MFPTDISRYQLYIIIFIINQLSKRNSYVDWINSHCCSFLEQVFWQSIDRSNVSSMKLSSMKLSSMKLSSMKLSSMKQAWNYQAWNKHETIKHETIKHETSMKETIKHETSMKLSSMKQAWKKQAWNYLAWNYQAWNYQAWNYQAWNKHETIKHETILLVQATYKLMTSYWVSLLIVNYMHTIAWWFLEWSNLCFIPSCILHMCSVGSSKCWDLWSLNFNE